MINLQPTIDRIRALLDQNTAPAIVYAALEARLAIEKVCYDRLRQAHDYISHDQLKRWQPGNVINQLLEEVDPYVTTTCKLSISKFSIDEKPDSDESDFVEIGTQIGFNHRKLSDIWNALSNLALHIKLPSSKEDRIPEFPASDKVKSKILEALTEFERLSSSSMSMSGFGEELSFECSCGQLNKRRLLALKDGSIVHCASADCRMAWKAVSSENGFIFECQTIDFSCSGCGMNHHLSPKEVWRLRRDQVANHRCDSCKTQHIIQWVIGIRPAETITPTPAP